MPTLMSSDDLKRRKQSGEHIQLIDVRSQGEFASGHIPGAVNIPVEQVESRIEDLTDQGDIVLICQSGDRACIAETLLRSHSKNLIVLENGTDGWMAQGHPVVRTTQTRWALERQVRLVAGLIVLVGTGLVVAGFSGWIYVAMFIGAGLTFSGITNFCGMASLLAKLPWNKPMAVAK